MPNSTFEHLLQDIGVTGVFTIQYEGIILQFGDLESSECFSIPQTDTEHLTDPTLNPKALDTHLLSDRALPRLLGAGSP